MKKIIIAFIAIVLAEIAMFILVGKIIGVFSTLLLILLTSVVGIAVAKKQGIHSVQNIRNSMANGEPPGLAMIDTFLIFLGGILLVLPGFISDLIGFAMLLSFTRRLFRPVIINWIRKKMKNGQMVIIQR